MKNEIAQDFLASTASKADIAYPYGETSNSYAFIKNGRLVVRHPPEGPYPIVIPCPGIRLIVNGQDRTQPTPVSVQDTALLKAVNEQREGKWSLTVSSDGLQAVLRINPTVIIHREVAELLPARKLQLAVVEREQCLSPLTLSQLLQELSRLGINYGVDWEACSRGAASCAKEEVVVARGTPPEPGKDGLVELLFSSVSKLPVLAEEEEAVDFRERYVFSSVMEGEILAVKHLPEIGRPGVRVKGDVILPPAPSDFALSTGTGAVLSSDGERVVAARAGRPVAYHSRRLVRVSVLPELVHTGNVDLASGNITFKGDVVITGNVEEGMAVEADGNVRVGGLVSGARVKTTGSVLIRGNILASAVTAGGNLAFIQEILPQVRTLTIGLREMIMAIYQLSGHPAFKQGDLADGIGPLLRLLLEGKFRYLTSVAEAFKKQVETLPPELAGEGLNKFIKEFERVVHTPLGVRDLQEVEKLSQRALEWEQAFTFTTSAENNVVAANILNSTVTASGDIRVLGGGCYNSRIQAGKRVIVSGVFRGGEIQAGEEVHVGELGSRGGSATRVMAGPRAIVTLKYAFENSLVLVGGQVYRFDRKEKDVRLWLNKEGNLQSRVTPA